MKQFARILALVLCVALAVFAFAACSKSGKTDATTAAKTAAPTAAGTTAEATTGGETEHVHTPASEYTIDRDATCANAGQKSYHCTECGQVIPETVVLIDPLPHTPEPTITIIQKPTCNAKGVQAYICEVCGQTIDSTIEDIDIDPNAHVVEEWSATPSLLNPSVEATGECTVCHQNIPKTLTYEPPIKVFQDVDRKFKTDAVKLGDVREEGEHFYPTESDPVGNDLYIEFNILWNESTENFDSAANPYIIGHMGSEPFFYLSPVPGCKYSDAQFYGAFEYTGNYKTPVSDLEVTTPTGMVSAGENFSDYPNIAGDDEANPEWGWHRMGIRIHVELLDGKTGEDLKDYVAVMTCYIDGVALYKLSTGGEGLPKDVAKLFTAESDGQGGVTYGDPDENEIVAFEIPHAKSKVDNYVYFAIDDLTITCGKGFVKPVEKVTNPTAATYTVAEGVEVASTVWFKAVEN